VALNREVYLNAQRNVACLQFNIQLGRKGMMELLGQVPSWITIQEKERVVVSPPPPGL